MSFVGDTNKRPFPFKVTDTLVDFLNAENLMCFGRFAPVTVIILPTFSPLGISNSLVFPINFHLNMTSSDALFLRFNCMS